MDLEPRTISSIIFSPSTCPTLLQTSLPVVVDCSGPGRKNFALLSRNQTYGKNLTDVCRISLAISPHLCNPVFFIDVDVDLDLDLAVRIFANRHLVHYARRSPDRLPTLPHSHYTRPSRTPHSPTARYRSRPHRSSLSTTNSTSVFPGSPPIPTPYVNTFDSGSTCTG